MIRKLALTLALATVVGSAYSISIRQHIPIGDLFSMIGRQCGVSTC